MPRLRRRNRVVVLDLAKRYGDAKGEIKWMSSKEQPQTV
jgi:hypothetical protein